MKSRYLPGIAGIVIGSKINDPENLLSGISMLQERLADPKNAWVEDELREGIRICQERLAEIERCETCGAAR